MISLKRLIMLPGSPDRAIEQAWSIAESGVARIAHVNRLARDIMDLKYYEYSVGGSTIPRVSSKKMIIKVDSIGTASSFTVPLVSVEFEADYSKFYFQLSLRVDNDLITDASVVLSSINDGSAELYVSYSGDPIVWGDVYVYVDILKL